MLAFFCTLYKNIRKAAVAMAKWCKENNNGSQQNLPPRPQKKLRDADAKLPKEERQWTPEYLAMWEHEYTNNETGQGKFGGFDCEGMGYFKKTKEWFQTVRQTNTAQINADEMHLLGLIKQKFDLLGETAEESARLKKKRKAGLEAVMEKPKDPLPLVYDYSGSEDEGDNIIHHSV